MITNIKAFHEVCREIITAYNEGLVGDTTMPEDSNPGFKELENKRIYFTLPMSLNYRRQSYQLWQAAYLTYTDIETHNVFVLKDVIKMSEDELREKLTKHRLALLPNKHTETWAKISESIFNNWATVTGLFDAVDNDYAKLKETVQVKYKKDFPYLAGPKIFNYWSYIMSWYGEVPMQNKDQIEVAVDTHLVKCSVKLGVISEDEALKLSRKDIALIWRELLKDTGITPVDMNNPLWFWSKNNFIYKLK